MNQIVGDFREEPEARHDDVVRHDTRIALVQSLKQEYAASLRAVGSGAEWDRVPLLVSMHAPSRAAGKGVARVSPTDDRHQIGIGRLSQVRSLAVGRFRPQPRMSRNAHAFTLTEILVSLAIIAVLIGILLPSLAMVRKTSQKVVCASNLRQSGLGLHMYATDNADFLPLSTSPSPQYLAQRAVLLRSRASRPQAAIWPTRGRTQAACSTPKEIRHSLRLLKFQRCAGKVSRSIWEII